MSAGDFTPAARRIVNSFPGLLDALEDPDICRCLPKSGLTHGWNGCCGPDCENRLLQVECPGTHKCSNVCHRRWHTVRCRHTPLPCDAAHLIFGEWTGTCRDVSVCSRRFPVHESTFSSQIMATFTGRAIGPCSSLCSYLAFSCDSSSSSS